MRIPSGALTAYGSDTPESKATFVVVESGSCRVPAVSKLPDITTNKEIDDDYMPEVYSYPLHDDYSKERYHTNGKIVNMRVDIKMKVLPGTGTMAPPSTPAHISASTRIAPGGAVAPPTTPTNAPTEIIASHSWREEDNYYHENDVIDAYGPYERTIKSMILRNRSAPPVMSQYRTRLTTTSQWIKKRAVADSSYPRNIDSKGGRPSTSVRPFSEREPPEAVNPHLSRVCIQPPLHPSRISMPDFGSFRGRPPISPAVKALSKQKSRYAASQSARKQGSETSETSTGTPSSSRNKVEQYVSELRKSIKTRKSAGENGHKRPTPFAVWAISNSSETSSVSAELEAFESTQDSPSSSPIAKDTLNSKANEQHTVRREIIKQITDNAEEKENLRRRHFLEVKGDTPPGIPASENLNPSESRIEIASQPSLNKDVETETPISHTNKRFPRGKTTLYTTAQRGTLRYARQLLARNEPSHKNYMKDQDNFPTTAKFPNYSDLKLLQSSNDHTLPYLKLHHGLVDYRSYKQGGAPFVRTLI